jgi:uncharacterized protein YcfJ
MNKSLIIGLIVGAVVVTAGGAIAMRSYSDRYAEVVDVKPVTKTVSTPRQVCEDEVVTRQKPVKDDKRITGTVLGAVVGGVLGHQVGSGRGQDVATAAGAAAGGYAGNRVQKNVQEGNTYQTTEQHCRTEYDSKQETVGYDVRYSLNHKESVVRMDHDPGSRIPVKDGVIDVNSSS